MKHLNKIKLLLFFTLFVVIFFMPEIIFASTNLFISTYPFKAKVYINNKYIGKSPIVMINIDKGEYNIKLEKKGYQPFFIKLNLNQDKTYNYLFKLIPETINFYMLDNFKIKRNGKEIENPFAIMNISNGLYEIKVNGDHISFYRSNFYTFAKWITLGAGTGLIGAFFLLNTITTTDDFTKGTITGYKNAALAVGIITLGLSIYFFIKDMDYKASKIKIKENPVVNEDQIFFNNAMNFLNIGNFNSALKLFLEFLDKYPDSMYYPSALYYVGYIYQYKGDIKRAVSYYETLIFEYPVIQWYDITLYSLGTIYYQNKLYKKSAYYFENILFNDILIQKDEVYYYLFKNYYNLCLKQKDNAKYKTRLNYYFELFYKKYKNSDFKDEVYYLFAKYIIELKVNDKISLAKTILQLLINENSKFSDKAKILLKKIN